MGVYTSTNPADGTVTATYQEISDEALDGVITTAAQAQKAWASRPAEERATVLASVARTHRERREELAAVLTREMGKPISQARKELDIVAAIFDYYAEHLQQFLGESELPIRGEGSAVIRNEPIGVLLGVMPWNYPYYQVVRFVAPNLGLGNAVFVKHARNCPEAALMIEQVLRASGVPEGVYTNTFISSAQVEQAIADPRVAGVSLTGSERAGEAVGAAAGRHLKRAVLELGGADPFVVLDDADVAEAAKVAAA